MKLDIPWNYHQSVLVGKKLEQVSITLPQLTKFSLKDSYSTGKAAEQKEELVSPSDCRRGFDWYEHLHNVFFQQSYYGEKP